MEGQCRTLNFAAFGSEDSQKNDFLRYLQSIPSFEHILVHNFPVPPLKANSKKSQTSAGNAATIAARALTEEHQRRAELLADDSASRFTNYCSMDIPLPKCARANAHRLHVVSGPSNSERMALCRDLLGEYRRGVSSILPTNQIHAVLIFCSDEEDQRCAAMEPQFHALEIDDDWDEKRKLERRKKVKESQPLVLKYLDMCKDHEVERVLFIKSNGGEISSVLAKKIAEYNDESPSLYYDATSTAQSFRRRTRAVVLGNEEREANLELIRAFFQFVEDVHESLEADDATIAQRQTAFEESERRRKETKLPRNLPALNNVCSRLWSEDGSHNPEAHHRIEFGLVGEPGSGKTTFITGLVDRFVIRQHVSTTSLECAHASVDLGDSIGPVNLVFHDGPLPPKDIRVYSLYGTPGGPSPPLSLTVLLLFVDARDPYGLQSASECLTQFPFPRPPYLAVILTHTDEANAANATPALAQSTSGFLDDRPLGGRTVTITSEAEARLFAGNHNAYFAVLDCRRIEDVTAFVERVVIHVQLEASQARLNLERQLLISQHNHNFADTKKLYVPHTEEDITIAFHRYDTKGEGIIVESDAKNELERLGLTLFVSFDDALKGLEKKYGPLPLTELGEKVITKDQFALLMCRLSSL